MNKTEAMEWAADYAERSKIFEPIRNERGYADQWKPPTPAEKARIIMDLAQTVIDFDTSSCDASADELFKLLEITVAQLNMARSVEPLRYDLSILERVHKALIDRLKETRRA